MTANDLQQQLDANGFAAVPPGETSLGVPVFLGPKQSLVGASRQGCKLQAYYAGTAVVVGWRRGLLDDTFFPPNAFRTNGVAHLFGRGTELDLGPVEPGGLPGWNSLTSLKIEYEGEKHGSTWVYQPAGGGDNDVQVLAGVRAEDKGFAAAPSPWLLWWSPGGVLTLSLRFEDGIESHLTLPGDPTESILDVSLLLDFENGTLTGLVNGVTVARTIRFARLARNTDWPFSVGRACCFCNESGYWGQAVGDVTVTKVKLSSGNWTAAVNFSTGRPGTYPGGPSLPLIGAFSNYGTRYLFAVHKDQGPSDAAGDTSVRGVTIESGTANPLVVLGAVQGQTVFQDVGGLGGTRFVQTSGLAGVYPLMLSDVFAREQKDRQLFLMKVANLTVRDADFGYGVRAAATLWGCTGQFDTVLIAPPTPAQDVVIEQIGGVMTYARVFSDYEYTPAPAAFLRVTRYSFEGQADPTTARAFDCVTGTAPFLATRPGLAYFTGPVLVQRDGQTAYFV